MTTTGNVSALLAHIPSSPEQEPDNDDELIKSDTISESYINPQISLVGHLFFKKLLFLFIYLFFFFCGRVSDFSTLSFNKQI